MTQVLLGIGSNIERRRHIGTALEELRAQWPGIVFSPVYESAAVGFNGEDFYNLVAAFETDEPLARVEEALRGIEDAHGRDRAGPKFSARTLDLDLLTWGDAVIDDGRVTLPRPEILRFDFVLRPLADIVPGERHPTAGATYRDLWSRFSGEPAILRVVDERWDCCS